jgi:hypothetical protein
LGDRTTTGGVAGGFAIQNDGFPWQTGQPGLSYAQDNNSCVAGISDITLGLTLSDIAADTPMNCSGTVTCQGTSNWYSISCDAAPEYYQLDQFIDGEFQAQDYAQGTASSRLQFAGILSGGAAFKVCSFEGSQVACTGEIPMTIVSTCPTRTVTGGGGSNGGTGCGGVCKE